MVRRKTNEKEQSVPMVAVGSGHRPRVVESRGDDGGRPHTDLAFGALWDAAGDACIAVDAMTGSIVSANAAACSGLGLHEDVLCTRHVWDFDDTIVDQGSWAAHVAGLQEAGPVTRTTVLRGAPGQKVPVEVRMSYADGAAPGGPPCVVLIARDITERRAHEAERMKTGEDLLRVVDMLPDVIFSCEKRADGKIYWTLNEGKLAQEFGLTTKQIEGKSLEELFPGGASEHIRNEFERNFAGEAHIWINQMGDRWFRHYPQPVFDDDGNVSHVVGFIAEVTELVEAEREIRRLNEQLETKLEDLARANQDLEAFSYTVSHDLRTPLAAVDTMVQAMSEAYADRLDAKAHERFGKIRRQLDGLASLIEDVLALSRAGRSEIEPGPVDIHALATESVERLQTTEPERQVHVAIEDDLSTWGDAGLIGIVVDNLVRNAWKYSARESRAKIEIGKAPTKEGETFFVRDNGIGFDMAHADRMFEAFGRLQHEVEFKGIGIGLATVHRIIDRHGGRVWAEGEPGRGATFWFSLPSPRIDAKGPAEDPSASPEDPG